MRRGGRQGHQGAELAAELLRSLFTGSKSKPEQQQARRRSEWTCSCGVTNFDDRQVCRQCGAERAGRHAQVFERSIGKPKAESKPDVRGLGKAAVAAQAAGASPSIVESLKKEATDERSRAADARPIGSRLNDGQKSHRKSEQAVSDARKASQAAQTRLGDSLRKLDASQANLDALEADWKTLTGI